MSYEEKLWLKTSRVAFIAISSFLVTIPQLIWTLYGYRGTFIIILQTLTILVGFGILLMALMDPLPVRVLKFLSLFRKETYNKQTGKFKWTNPRLYVSLIMLGYLYVPYQISIIMGYSKPGIIIEAFFIAVSTACIIAMIYLHGSRLKGRNVWPGFYYVILAVLGLAWTINFWYGSPRFPTDEMTLDYYSAHVFLHGMNPYIPANTANVFSFYQFGYSGYPLNVITPFSTGGYVTNLSYPALSVFPFAPSSILGIPPSATLIPFYVLPVIFVYWAYRAGKLQFLALLPPFLLLLNPSLLVQVSLGYPDIIWVIFTMMSVFFYRKPVLSGVLMGLAVSVKQIPWLVIPFLLIFLFRETGGRASAKWVISALLVFIAVNSIFLIQDPGAFLRAVIAPELQKIIGIGFGPSQLSFLDIVPLSRTFFTMMMISTFASSLVAYLFYYKRIKYAFLAFPIVIFLFNYRLLLSYLMFWPIIALVMPLFIREKTLESEVERPVLEPRSQDRPAIRKYLVPVLLVAILAIPVAYQGIHPSDPSSIQFQAVDVSKVTNNNVTQLSIIMNLHADNISYNQILYRVMPAAPTTNMNGYLWTATSFTALTNGSERIYIVPMDNNQVISWNGSYRLIAYYGSISSAVTFHLESGHVLTV